MFFSKKIIYIIEDAEWSVAWDGRYITKNISKLFKTKATTFNVANLKSISKFRSKILHFGSRSTFLPYNYKLIDDSNKIVLTWFHGTDKDKGFIEALATVSKKINIIHTSCTLTKRQLVKWGAEEDKIIIIPLGVDLSLFKPLADDEKVKIRDEIGIPRDSICIGSFQKDGNGWGEGNTPKLIKGPDIFCEVIKKIKKDYPIFVLLTGPARGYVKNRLKKMGVPFKHFYLNNYIDIPKYYNALDYYIISSRTEGGPKAILECFATGIPFVTTRVGMVDDIITNGENGLVSEVEDVNNLTINIRKLIEDAKLKEKLISNGLRDVKVYDWLNIARQYFDKIYSKLL